jgi:predicted dehydrogenase
MTDRLIAGVIGFGVAGEFFHSRFLATNPNYELRGVVTTDAARAERARALAPTVEVFASAAEMLQSGQFDLVVVASPPALHVEHATAALERGAAVVVDKPFAPTVADANRIVEAAVAHDRPLVVYQNRRWDRDFRTIQRMLADGALGTPHTFESRFEWWKPELGQTWKSTTTVDAGGGVLLDLGPHLVDQAVQLLGPVRTVAHARLRILRDGAAADDDAFLELEHESGVVSRLNMGSLVGAMGPRFRLSGTKGTVVVEGLDQQERALRVDGAMPSDPGFDRDTRVAHVGAGDERATVALDPGSYQDFYDAVAAAIRGEGPVPVDPRDAVRTMEILEEARRLA